MTGQLAGRVAFITGAARGQGRSHAIHLAREGADIIGVDLCDQINSVMYPMSTAADLEETVAAVEETGQKMVGLRADVRHQDELAEAFNEGVTRLGAPYVVVANAGIGAHAFEEPPEAWQDTIDVNLTGVFNTVDVAIPSMIERGEGGSIVLTSSSAGLRGIGGSTRAGLAYAAAKHGVTGLMRAYANDLGKHSIRVNSIHPSGVNTPMIMNEPMQKYFSSFETIGEYLVNVLPVEVVEVDDISRAVMYLVSESGRYVTGLTMSVDAGLVNHR